MRHSYPIIAAAALMLTFSNCNKQKFLIQEELPVRILHLSHTRMQDNTAFNPQLHAIDYNQYDVLLLGGDLAASTSADTSVMDSLDHLFQLKRESTLWALGNHDDANRSLVSEYTGRGGYYAYHSKGITFLVLDTQENSTKITGPQLEFVRAVLDTIEVSSHLILLHHKLAWLYDDGLLLEQANDIANGMLGDCHYCTNPNNFYTDVYPRLEELAQAGVEVFCIGGDLGFIRKTFHHQPADRIHFIATGFYYDDPENKALLMEYYPQKRELNWEFREVNTLR